MTVVEEKIPYTVTEAAGPLVAGLPVWSGSEAAPVPAGKPFPQGPGGPVLIAQPQ